MKKLVRAAMALAAVMVLLANTAFAQYVSIPHISISRHAIDFRNTLNVGVYSGPGYEYKRGANGKAQFISDSFKYVGLEGSWLFVRCKVRDGVRYGYIDVSRYSGEVWDLPRLYLSAYPAVTTRYVYLWDSMEEPAMGPLATLAAGTDVTYLAVFDSEYGAQYAYVEAVVNGQKVRGFADINSISLEAGSSYGTSQGWTCSHCGNYNQPGANYCAYCGIRHAY